MIGMSQNQMTTNASAATTSLTRKQKEALAFKLLIHAGDIVEYWGTGTDEMEGVTSEQVAAQLAVWLKGLPGTVWDNRLPQPK